jgi:hypothetical protein
MQTRNGTDEITPLPPPPAPPARDANPWPMPEASGQAARGPRALASIRRAGKQDPGSRPTDALRASVAIGLAVMIMTVALIQARKSGELEDLAGALFALFLLVMFAVTRLRKARRRAARGGPTDRSSPSA